MQQRSEQIFQCIQEAQQIREAVDKLSRLQDKALLHVMGISDHESSTYESDQDDIPSDTDRDSHALLPSDQHCNHSFDTLLSVLKDGKYNWFVVVEFSENDVITPCSEAPTRLDEFYSYALSFQLTPQEKSLLTSSYAAFQASKPSVQDCRTASLLNGEIVSDSESDQAEDYVGLKLLASDRAKQLIAKRRTLNGRRMRRLRAKKLAERNFLGRQKNKQVQSVVTRFPDIGEAIESYVSECNVGADAF